jgi:hypothetical protein
MGGGVWGANWHRAFYMFKEIISKKSKSRKALLIMLHVGITVLMYRYKLTEYRFRIILLSG